MPLSASIRPVTGKVWATAPLFCGLKILRDGIRGCTDLRCSVQAFDEIGGEASRRHLKRGAIRLQRHLPREPLMVVFQTAKLRRGVQMSRPTRSNADGRQITTILQ